MTAVKLTDSDSSLVSVITPCLNPGKRLAACLASVAAQTYPHIEHIVIDGGSSDGTIELLGKSNVTWVSEPDSGQSEAINRGLQRAHGSIVSWLNADDRLEVDAVERIVAAFAHHPNVDFISADCVVEEGDKSRVFRSPDRLTPDELDWSSIPQPACFISKAAFTEVGPLDTDLHLAMDLDLWYRLVLGGFRYLHLPDVIAWAEVHQDAKTQSAGKYQWAKENGSVRLRHGRLDAAARDFGLMIAVKVLQEKVHRDGKAICNQWDQFHEALPTILDNGFRETVIAVGYVEFASLDRSSRFLKFRHVLHPSVWRNRISRRLLQDRIVNNLGARNRGIAEQSRMNVSTASAGSPVTCFLHDGCPRMFDPKVD